MNEKLSIQDITNLLAEKHGISKEDAENFVKEFFLIIERALSTDKIVKIKGLGTFKLVDVESRESINVNTGERIQIQGHTKVSFIPEAALKDIINKPFAHFETVVLNDNTVLEDTPLEEGTESSEDTEEAVSQKENKNETKSPTEASLSSEEIIARELQKAKVEFPFQVNVGRTSLGESAESPGKNSADKKSGIKAGKPGKEKSPIPYLITIIIVVLLLCGGAILFIYFPDLLHPSTGKSVEDVVSKVELTPDTIVSGNLNVAEKAASPVVGQDTTVAPGVSIKKNPEESSKKKEAASQVKVPVIPDSVTYEIKGTKTTYTIQEGETLTKVALRFYGTKALWPYIVQHNRDVIKNPDNVPYGTKIKIPELVKK